MAQPLPALENARDEGEAERNAIRMQRQLAIREGRYLPPLPHLPIFMLPRGAVPNDGHNPALEFQLNQRRQFLLENIRPAAMQPPGFFHPRPEDEYRPISPTNSDDEAEEEEEVLELQRRVRRNWRHYMNLRAEPIPQEIVDRLLHEHDQLANFLRNNNNNDNFRDFNGVLSPSPSPAVSPAASPAPSEDPIDQAREDDEDIKMLNVQLLNLRPNQPRPRKRHNSGEEVLIKRKKVTFKDEIIDEVSNQYEEHPADYNDNVKVYRKQFDDDDEGFLGGPSAYNHI
uniref:Pecanex-like protein n=1 Tax=Caenorhabditis tropicalis TaxID=1561998 RepID=A0A1I7US28_9PELO